MPFKIINPKDRVSSRDWSDVDLSAMRRKLVDGLEEGASGVRLASREAYAVLMVDDLNEAPSSNWRLPHHEVKANGDVVLNTNGLDAAAGRINQTDAPAAKIKKAANHLARHYRQIECEIPQGIKDIIGDDNSMERNKYTLSARGFVNLSTGEIEMPPPGSVMVANFHSALQPIEMNARRALQIAGAEEENLARRKEKWPEGASEDDKFIYATYRALSSTIVNGLDTPIDFSKKGVLKKATKFLKDQPFLKDHDRSIDSQIGKVTDTLWDDGEGNIPGGINALVRINVRAPQSATVIPLIEEGDANSVSVTVWYEWEKSHPEIEDWDYIWALGTEVDGELVRIIVTKILDIGELSLVWDGADPYAERIEASAAPQEAFASFAVGLPVAPIKKEFDRKQSINFESNKEDAVMLEKLRKAVAQMFGKDIEQIDEQFVTDLSVGAISLDSAPAVVDLLSAKQGKVDEYVALLETRGEEIGTLKAEVEAMKSESALGKKYLEDMRASAIKFYKMAEGDASSDTILTMIEMASLEQAIALRDQFRKQADEKVPLKCEACGSEKVSRASSAPDSKETVGEPEPTAASSDDTLVV